MPIDFWQAQHSSKFVCYIAVWFAISLFSSTLDSISFVFSSFSLTSTLTSLINLLVALRTEFSVLGIGIEHGAFMTHLGLTDGALHLLSLHYKLKIQIKLTFVKLIMSIIVAFELGYIFTLIAQVIIVRQIRTKKHVEGISFYSQMLIAVAQIIKILYFPFTILKEYYICWIEYVLTATVCAYIMYLFRIYHRMSLNKEQNYFDWRILMVLSVLFAFVSNYEKNEPFEYS